MKHITKIYQLEVLLKLKVSKEIIANELGVYRSTIYREISRNKLKRDGYSAKFADEYAVDRKDLGQWMLLG